MPRFRSGFVIFIQQSTFYRLMKKEFTGIGAYAIGHRWGLNPRGTIAEMVKENMKVNLDAMIQGYEQGRKDLIEFNGADAIKNPPRHVLCMKTMSDFLYNGILEIGIDDEEYNATQLKHIKQWIERGLNNREEDFIIQIMALLQSKGISVKN